MTAGLLSVSKGGIHLAKKTKKAAPQSRETAGIKSFLDMIAPSVVKFEPDHFICGNTFRCVWALREYPTQTDEQAILRHLGEKDGITLRIYTRQVTPAEEKRIIQNAANKNRMSSSNTNDLQQTITAESNLQDVASLVASMHRNREPLLHCAVYIELTASDYNTLKLLQTDVLTELVRSKLNVDRLLLRQQQGFCCASPVGYNAFGQQFERVLPASSVANLLCDTMELNICKGDGSEESWSYPLNAAEQEVLLCKMEAFCQQQTGMSLHEYARQLRDSETQAPEMQM